MNALDGFSDGYLNAPHWMISVQTAAEISSSSFERWNKAGGKLMEKFDKVVSLGYDSEVSFLIEKYCVGGGRNISILMGCIKDRDKFIESLLHLDRITEGGNIIYEPRTDSFLFENYMLSVSRKAVLTENLSNTSVEETLIETVRNNYCKLANKLSELFESSKRTLFIVKVQHTEIFADKEFIKKLADIIHKKYRTFNYKLVVVMEASRNNDIISKLENEHLMIRYVGRFTDGANAVKDSDWLGWLKIFEEVDVRSANSSWNRIEQRERCTDLIKIEKEDIDMSKSVDTILYGNQEKSLWKVILYGAGSIGKQLKRQMDERKNIIITAWVDMNYEKLSMKENKVYNVSIIKELDFDYVVIAVLDRRMQQEIRDSLIKLGVHENKLLYYLKRGDCYLKRELLMGLEKEVFVRQMIVEYLLQEAKRNKMTNWEIEWLAQTCEKVRRGGNYDFREWYLDKEQKIAYLRIAKAACTSIIKCLREFDDGVDIHKTNEWVLEDLSNYKCFKFTYVRNPFSRLVSCYKNKIMGRDISLFTKISGYAMGVFGADLGFEHFVNQVIEIPDKWADRHFRSQYSYVYDENGKCLVDYIGKIENMPGDFDKIRKRFNLRTLEYMNVSPKDDWRSYYTEEIAYRVYEYYQKDIVAFGYEGDFEELLNFLRAE